MDRFAPGKYSFFLLLVVIGIVLSSCSSDLCASGERLAWSIVEDRAPHYLNRIISTTTPSELRNEYGVEFDPASVPRDSQSIRTIIDRNNKVIGSYKVDGNGQQAECILYVKNDPTNKVITFPYVVIKPKRGRPKVDVDLEKIIFLLTR